MQFSQKKGGSSQGQLPYQHLSSGLRELDCKALPCHLALPQQTPRPAELSDGAIAGFAPNLVDCLS